MRDPARLPDPVIDRRKAPNWMRLQDSEMTGKT
jgi:hypothetical protein